MQQSLSPAALEQIAHYFQALSDPTRLMILASLKGGELNVGELATVCACSMANISKHLALLSKHGIVSRRPVGTSVYYQLEDASFGVLCDLVCDRIVRNIDTQTALVTSLRASAERGTTPPAG